MATLRLRPSGAAQPIEVAIHRCATAAGLRYNVSAGDHHADVEMESTGPGAGWLRVQGRVVPFRVSRAGRNLAIWMGGRVYRFELVERMAHRAAGEGAAAARDDLPAPMPGTILRILAGPGEAFAAHDPLVIMESMKMELTLSAPQAGRVREVCCQPGQLVEMGQVLVRFENPHDAPAA
jgi:biotin carboxyl carrier protein